MTDQARILVVDADPSARAETVAVLGDAGYACASCGSVSSCVELAETFRPDLVLLEMRLGGSAVGPELAQRLRAVGDPLLVFASPDPADADRLGAYEAGADDYVVKPFAFPELLAQLHALLRRSGRPWSRVVQVGRLVIDEPAHRVFFAGREVHLSPVDFALLSVLARHAGQVLSKAQLLEKVWGYEIVGENLVEVHVSTLRRGLGAEAARLVKTVRQVGYVLRDDVAARDHRP